VICKGMSELVSFTSPFHSLDEMLLGRTDPTIVSKDEFAKWSDGVAFPQLPNQDSGLVLQQLNCSPRFDDPIDFELRPVAELHSSGDRTLFNTDLTRSDLDVPVLAGASIGIWEPDHGEPYALAGGSELTRHFIDKARRTNTHTRSAFYGLNVTEISEHPFSRARIAFRDVARATDSRTAIFCLVPPKVALIDLAPYLLRRSGDEKDEAFALGILSSIPFDWCSRRWVELHLKINLLASMPMPRPARDHPLRERVVELSGCLAAKDERFSDWSAAVGVPIGSLTDSPDREAAIAELDALSALLYELEWAEVVHIFETFHRGWDYTERLAAVQVHFDRWKDST